MSAVSNTPSSFPTSAQNASHAATNSSSDSFSIGMLPTPSSSSSAPDIALQSRSQLEQQLAEKEKLLQDSRGGIGKSVLFRQITQLKDSLLELDRRQQQQQQQALPSSIPHPLPLSPKQSHPRDESDLSAATLEKLHKLEKDIRGFQLSPSSSTNGNGYLRKDKLGTRSSGLESLPSPSNSTMLPSDSSTILPLPPPPTGSAPTKRRSKVPNADRRNTDIEFATEIGQGLLVEVRKMQALLQEKEDKLKLLQAQKADLERAAESMAKQLRQREESEEKLKEETWNLELAKQELTVSVTELQQNLDKANAEQKRMSQQMKKLNADIESMRDQEQKLSTALKQMKQQHERDMNNLRRHAAVLQREKGDSAKQIEALSSELAISKAQTRLLGAGASANKRNSLYAADISRRKEGDGANAETESCSVDIVRREGQPNDNSSSSNTSRHVSKETGEQPSQTPPPSPKQTSAATIARNRELEVESLKSSLAHAHRLVSNLRSNLLREKQEKHEINKLLAEARERIELLENDPRLWIDDYSSTTAKGPDSGGHRRSRTKSNQKRRVPVSKTRVTMLPSEGSEKRRTGSDDDEAEDYDDVDEDEDEIDDASATRAGLPGTAAPVVAVGGALAATAAAGLASLESELAAEKDRDGSSGTGPRSLGDELSAVDHPRQPMMLPSYATGPKARASATPGIEAGIQTDDAAGHTATDITSTMAPIMHELGVQTEHSMQNYEIVSQSAFEDVPAEAFDQGTQISAYVGLHANTQTDAVTAIDAGSQYQFEHEGIDQSTETHAPDVISKGVQSMETLGNGNPAAAAAATGAATGAAHAGYLDGAVDAAGSRSARPNSDHDEKLVAMYDGSPDDDILIFKNQALDPYGSGNIKRVYTEAETEAMVAAAVASALAEAEAKKSERHVNEAYTAIPIPPRPTSSPPARLLALVNQQIDKGKAPLVKPLSDDSSPRESSHRPSVSSSAYESTSPSSDGHIGTVTQTMIGDWLWKYTHKPFSDHLSDNRHRRYFWVHPYTRTIYWSTHRPGSHGSKIKTKSALIEGVSAVEDHNPSPTADAPLVSILIKTCDGQVIKVTAATLSRHQVWLESLQYLLARGESSGDDDDDDERNRNTTTAVGRERQQVPLSNNNGRDKRPSVQRFLRTFEQNSSGSSSSESGGEPRTHEDIGDDRLEDVRSCCEGKHHVSRLERESVNGRPFYRKRSSRLPPTQRSHGGVGSVSMSVPPMVSSDRPQRVN